MLLIITFAFVLLLLIVMFIKWLRTQRNLVIKDKHIIITGGSKGIGKELALACFKLGAKVSLIAKNKQGLEEAMEYILNQIVSKSDSNSIQIYSIDVTQNFINLKKAVEKLEANFGPVFGLFNLVGKATSLRFQDTPIEEFQNMINVNYLSTVNCIRAVLPTMMAQKKGLIEITSSIGGLVGIYGYSAYSPSKYALRGLAEALFMELKPYNINITLAVPPDTDTPGFAEENKTKPLETKLISKSAGLELPSTVAQKILKDTLSKKFMSTMRIEGFMIGNVCAGMMPISNGLELIVQICLMGLFRLISVFYLRKFNQIVLKCFKKQEKSKTS